jgi:uncharacterized membrane protein
MNEATVSRHVLAASFDTPDSASRAATVVIVADGGKIANTAVIRVTPDGTPTFVESKDWGAGRGALVGGTIGLIGGPLGVLAGGAIGGFTAKLRDVGFPDSDLKRLGKSLEADHSVVVFEIADDAVPSATGILESLSARQIVTQRVDADLAAVFAAEPRTV